MMNAGNTDHSKMQYAMPDMADVLAKAGAAFQGSAWVNDAAYSNKHAIAGMAAIEEKHLITEADINGISAQLRNKCLAAGVPLSQIDRVCDQLRSNVGVSKSQLSELASEAWKEAEAMVADAIADKNSAMGAETPEQFEKRFWESNVKNKKTVNESFEEGLKNGTITKEEFDAHQNRQKRLQEEKKKLEEEKAAIAAMPEGEEKEKAKKQYTVHQDALYSQEYASANVDKQVLETRLSREETKANPTGVASAHSGINSATNLSQDALHAINRREGILAALPQDRQNTIDEDLIKKSISEDSKLEKETPKLTVKLVQNIAAQDDDLGALPVPATPNIKAASSSKSTVLG